MVAPFFRSFNSATVGTTTVEVDLPPNCYSILLRVPAANTQPIYVELSAVTPNATSSIVLAPSVAQAYAIDMTAIALAVGFYQAADDPQIASRSLVFPKKIRLLAGGANQSISVDAIGFAI